MHSWTEGKTDFLPNETHKVDEAFMKASRKRLILSWQLPINEKTPRTVV